MKPVITLANQKGGVGKTTTAAAIIDGLRRRGAKVLAVDCDAQANLTRVQGQWVLPGQPGTVDFIKGRDVVCDADGQSSVPADYEDLVTIEDELDANGAPLSAMALGESIQRAMEAHGFDVCVIDTHPDANFLALSALLAATHVVIPAEAEVFAVDGINKQLDVMESLTTETDVDWDGRTGVLVTKVDRRRNLHRDVGDQIVAAFAGDDSIHVFGQRIRLSAIVPDQQARGLSIYDGQTLFRGAVSNYDWLVDEVSTWVADTMRDLDGGRA